MQQLLLFSLLLIEHCLHVQSSYWLLIQTQSSFPSLCIRDSQSILLVSAAASADSKNQCKVITDCAGHCLTPGLLCACSVPVGKQRNWETQQLITFGVNSENIGVSHPE